MPFPTLEGETLDTTLQFALVLRDAFADSELLLGDVWVQAGNIVGERKEHSGVFLFYDLNPGPQVLEVKSADDTPYYVAMNVAVTIPVTQPPPPAPVFPWPAFPDIRLADQTLPLRDPGQTAAYKTQRAAATLLPTVAYPFPGNATLIRGTVEHLGNKLADATVQQTGGTAPAYTTDAYGQFVLFLKDAPGIPQAVTVNAKHAGLADANVHVTVKRGLTVSVTIAM